MARPRGRRTVEQRLLTHNTARIRWWCCLLLVVSLCSVTHARPYYLLTDSGSKCFQYDVPHETTLEVSYWAPGTFLCLSLFQDNDSPCFSCQR